MARLNEPSTQIESVEALKRRFVRQNREIARVNSTQSLRIRNLESEISRLLSENITLREEVIRLQFEVDNNVGAASIDTVKGKLETKLCELGSLVQELGNLQQSAESRRTNRRRSGMKASPKTSPDQKKWKNALTVSEATGGADGRLPPIVEGKYYPRRTLDADDICGLLADSGDPADSPDLGPPPVAHFEAGDPIKFDASGQEPPKTVRSEDAGDFNPAFLVNLETRRKRRESSRPGEERAPESTDLGKPQHEPTDGSSKPAHILKSGAKRKFSVREEEDRRESFDASEMDGFQYNRAHENPQPDHPEEKNPGVKENEKQARQRSFKDAARSKDSGREGPKVNTNPAPASRNILAPKSVNTDPVSSPVKMSRFTETEKVKPPKLEVSSKPRDRNRTRDQPASQRFARPAKVPQVETSEAKAPEEDVPPPPRPLPKTPAAPPLDTFSPEGSEPPAARPESRDTPPPADLDPEVANINAFGSMGRASRRQRGSVSYAEPNLRDKMRRPTKELVDAVGVDERLQQKKATKVEEDATEAEPIVTGEGPSKMRTVTIKKELTVDNSLDWKALPTKQNKSNYDSMRTEPPSPLGNKAPAVKADLPASVVTERRRRPSILERDKTIAEGVQQSSGAGSTIVALMTDNAKPRSRDDSIPADELKQVSRAAETPEVYDIQGSSPAEADDVTAKSRKPAVARSSRRHSSVSDDRIKDAMARRAERKREADAAPDLKNVRSAATLAVDPADGARGRGERAASRRRSMML